jgi:hypothetical protein
MGMDLDECDPPKTERLSKYPELFETALCQADERLESLRSLFDEARMSQDRRHLTNLRDDQELKRKTKRLGGEILLSRRQK